MPEFKAVSTTSPTSAVDLEERFKVLEQSLVARFTASIENQLQHGRVQSDNKPASPVDRELEIFKKLANFEKRVNTMESDKHRENIAATRKRKFEGVDDSEVHVKMASMKEFADNTVVKVSDMEGRLDILELRVASLEENSSGSSTLVPPGVERKPQDSEVFQNEMRMRDSLMEHTRTTLATMAEKLSQNDKLLAKHQTAMVQMRDYLNHHQDFMDGLCKTMGIKADCGEDLDENTRTFPVKILTELVTRQRATEARLARLVEQANRNDQEVDTMKPYLKVASEVAKDWQQSKPVIFNVLNSFNLNNSIPPF